MRLWITFYIQIWGGNWTFIQSGYVSNESVKESHGNVVAVYDDIITVSSYTSFTNQGLVTLLRLTGRFVFSGIHVTFFF